MGSPSSDKRFARAVVPSNDVLLPGLKYCLSHEAGRGRSADLAGRAVAPGSDLADEAAAHPKRWLPAVLQPPAPTSAAGR